MHKNKIKLYSLILVTVVLAIGFSLTYKLILADWVEPPANPGESNVATPINIGTTTQSKEGSLRVNTVGNENGFIVYYGNVGVGSLLPYAKLDIAGGLKVGTDSICNVSKDGTIRYNFSNKKLEFCDSTSWKEFKIVCPIGFSDCNGDNTCECYAGTHHCSGTSCVVNTIPCTPNCTGKECGSDGCTGTCGSCGSHASCNGSGTCVCSSGYADCNNDNTCECATSNHHCSGSTCVCDPRTCSSLGATCGTYSDGCGGTVSCGTCSSGYYCDTSLRYCRSRANLACNSGGMADIANSWITTGSKYMVGCRMAGGQTVTMYQAYDLCKMSGVPEAYYLCEVSYKTYNNTCTGLTPGKFWLGYIPLSCPGFNPDGSFPNRSVPTCPYECAPYAIVDSGVSCSSDTESCSTVGTPIVIREQAYNLPLPTTDVIGAMCCSMSPTLTPD